MGQKTCELKHVEVLPKIIQGNYSKSRIENNLKQPYTITSVSIKGNIVFAQQSHRIIRLAHVYLAHSSSCVIHQGRFSLQQRSAASYKPGFWSYNFSLNTADTFASVMEMCE